MAEVAEGVGEGLGVGFKTTAGVVVGLDVAMEFCGEGLVVC